MKINNISRPPSRSISHFIIDSSLDSEKFFQELTVNGIVGLKISSSELPVVNQTLDVWRGVLGKTSRDYLKSKTVQTPGLYEDLVYGFEDSMYKNVSLFHALGRGFPPSEESWKSHNVYFPERPPNAADLFHSTFKIFSRMHDAVIEPFSTLLNQTQKNIIKTLLGAQRDSDVLSQLTAVSYGAETGGNKNREIERMSQHTHDAPLFTFIKSTSPGLTVQDASGTWYRPEIDNDSVGLIVDKGLSKILPDEFPFKLGLPHKVIQCSQKEWGAPRLSLLFYQTHWKRALTDLT